MDEIHRDRQGRRQPPDVVRCAGRPDLLRGGDWVGADLSSLGKAGKLVAENKLTFFSLGAFALILAVAGTVMGFVLTQAADDFERVVRTNEADQDFITAGLIQLETYFKISILLALAAAVVGMTAGISLALKYGTGS